VTPEVGKAGRRSGRVLPLVSRTATPEI
jgi:hypothetical protein